MSERKQVLDLLLKMTDQQRLSIFDEFCKECGSTDKKCQCWNDD